MPEPVTAGGALGIAAVVGAALKGFFTKSPTDDVNVLASIEEVRQQLHEDHQANVSRVEAIHADITDIKVDVAIVKTEVANLKERA